MSQAAPPPQRNFRDAVMGLLLWTRDWFYGNTVTVSGGDDEAEDGLREAITLLGILLAWQAALLVYVQSHPSWELSVIAVYVLVSMLPLVGILGICTTRRANSAAHAFKYTHRRLAWRLGIPAALLVTGLGFSYIAQILPGQYETGTYLDTGTKYLGVNLEREAVPVTTSTWRATLSERAAKHWRIDRVVAFRDKERTERLTSLTPDESKTTPASAVGYLDTQLSHKYYFRVELEEIGTEVRNFKFSKEDLDFKVIPGVK